MEATERIPKGFRQIERIDAVFISDKEIVICGDPGDEESESYEMHSCDQMGCGSLDHVIFRAPLATINESQQLKEAKASLERLREEFKDDPDLLAVYEPSALYLVEQLSSNEPEEGETNDHKA